MTTVSGDIDLNGSVGGKVVCNTTSGDVELRSPTIGDVEINTTSGDAELNDSYIQSLKVVSVSGDASLERVTAAGAVTIETTSGDVELGELRRGQPDHFDHQRRGGRQPADQQELCGLVQHRPGQRAHVRPRGRSLHRDHHQRRYPPDRAAVTGPAPQRAV